MLTIQNRYGIRDKSGNVYVLSTQLDSINRCMAFMRQVIYENKTCFQTDINAFGKTSRRLTLLAEHMNLLTKYPGIWSPHFNFHPALALFFEQYRKHEIRFCHKPHDPIGDGRLSGDIFDDFVSIMRKQVSSLGIKKKIIDWESKTRKNKARMLEIERQIFTHCPSVTVVPLSLEYCAATFDDKEVEKFIVEAASGDAKAKNLDRYWAGADLSSMEPLAGRVTFEEVRTDRERLFSNMKGKPSLFRHLIGFIWRIDCTPKAGYHLHVALFFDATQCEEQEWLAHQIGEYWSSDITQARGRYIIPGYKNSDRFGLRSISQSDWVARSNLREMVLSKLCAVDRLIQVLPHPGANMFGSKFTAGSPQKRRPARSKGL